MKRLFDLVAAALLLLALSPLLCVLTAAVRLRMGSPVIFRQKRPGLNGRVFTIYKFRTMTNQVDRFGNLLNDGHRLTRLGSLMRRSSLDELPELFNVIKGDMSLVGPRPLFPEYLPYYTPRERRRHDVRPGITGWAQIHGRNLVPWEERLELDVWYVENRSLWLDLYILVCTLWKVVRREGVVANSTTVETFLNVERAGRVHSGHAQAPPFRMMT